MVLCVRIRDECAAELAAYHARAFQGIADNMENRDSMGLLAAIFTGECKKNKPFCRYITAATG
jgi:hypothetical protein